MIREEMPDDLVVLTPETLKELIDYTERSGVKVFSLTNLTLDDEILVEVKKKSFLEKVKQWDEASYSPTKSCVTIVDGDVIIG